MKKCAKCLEMKFFNEFYKRTDCLSGFNSHCKKCLSENRQKNSAQISTQRKQYREKNKEKIIERNKENYAKDPERHKKRTAAYRLENPDKVQNYFDENRDKHAKKVAAYRSANPEAVRAEKAKRRSRIMNSGGSFSKSDIEELMQLQNGKCVVCKVGIKK